ncbi:hypothetical protein P9847_08625 [Paenibacillus chibensis]|uniref:Uncharacterized protein n=1 Tax=Paenibacillus chibensis TaxID=59846 RepID=A0ABU6PR62_9BACL|nr:hypothetical protein [Paenibacillus chibensis]
MYLSGLLGGEIMPEDANPDLPKGSAQNYLYFTLPMALNYQRNSYTLWDSARKSYEDEETAGIFNPEWVLSMEENKLRELLLKPKRRIRRIFRILAALKSVIIGYMSLVTIRMPV